MKLATISYVLLALSLSQLKGTSPAATSFMPLSEANARAALAATLPNLPADASETAFKAAFVKQAQKFAPDYLGSPFTVHSDNDLLVLVIGPAVRFQTDCFERYRKMLSIDTVTWNSSVSVEVYPMTINAPDIERVVLVRDSVIVAPTLDDLKPRAMKTRMDVSFIVHSGLVAFPLSAFSPTAREVTLKLIPASGSNIVQAFSSDALKLIQ